MESGQDLFDYVIHNKEEILSIAKRRGAKNIRLFGSVSRHEAGPDSDIDFLIDLEPQRSLLDVGGFAMDLQKLLNHKVDVVTEAGLRPKIRPHVLKDAYPL